jgi:hypothetical protein
LKPHRTFQGLNKVSGQFIHLNRVALISEFISFAIQNKKHRILFLQHFKSVLPKKLQLN